jgi:hypothetical protein
LGVDLGPDPVRLTIEPGQHNDKSGYYYIFKTQLGDWPGVRPGSRIKLTIDPGQRKDKNDYYHSFKIRLGGKIH